MGLDMYAFSVPASLVGDNATDPNLPEIGSYDRKELAYWRKFNHLHGWMHDLYRSKGGTDSDFNCNPVRLLADDLDALEQALTENRLTATAGFFFGDDTLYDEDIASLREFIENARDQITAGRAVYYDSWW